MNKGPNNKLDQRQRRAAEALFVHLSTSEVNLEFAVYELIALRAEVESLRVFKRSVDEALNSGDGSYRP